MTAGERPGLRAVLAGAALTAIPLSVGAAERPLWELGLGAGTLRLPHYRGSDQSHSLLLPVPYVVYRGEIFKADREGARAVLFDAQSVEVDLSVALSAPTRSEDNEARRGMDDLAPTFEFGPNVNWTLARGNPWKLDLRLPLRGAFTLESRARAIGWVAAPNLNLDIAHAQGWNLGLKIGPIYGSRRFHGYFYDVAPSEATATRAAYRAGGGAGGAQFTAALSRRFEHHWVGAFMRYDSLRDARFVDSPLVRKQSNLSFGVAMSWVFATSPTQVTVPD